MLVNHDEIFAIRVFPNFLTDATFVNYFFNFIARL